MKVRRITISKQQLGCIPPDERAMLVLSGHVLNEVNVIDKLTYLCSQSVQSNDWVSKANAMQSLVLVRVLCGKLDEAWAMLQKAYFRTKVSQTYDGTLDQEAQQALDALKSYFSKSNDISRVRDEFAFHFDKKHALAEVPDDATDEDMSMYLPHNGRVGNSLFYFADFLMNRSLMDAINAKAPAMSLESLLRELRSAVVDLNKFLLGLMYSVITLRIDKASLDGSATEVDVGHVPSSTRKAMPYFVEIP